MTTVHIEVGRPIPVRLCGEQGGPAIGVDDVEAHRDEICERCLDRYHELRRQLTR